MKKYVIDTNVLMSLENFDGLITHCAGEMTIPIYCIEELDHLKSREGDAGFQARRALRNLDKSKNGIEFFFPETTDSWCVPANWDKDYVDNKLINIAKILQLGGDDVTLVSNDLNVRIKCDLLFIGTESYHEVSKIGTGWTEINLSQGEFEMFQRGKEGKINKWNVPLNQYLVIRDGEGIKTRGVYKYFDESDWLEVPIEKVGSFQLGTAEPRDDYQRCVINSLLHDDFTVITGRAGSGKTLLSLTYCLREIQCEKRDKLIIFANPVKTKGSEQLGFYTGDRTEKLMQNSIGAMLTSKMGDSMAVEELIEKGRIEILPISDIRGFEVGKKQIMYITEAQNMSVELLKLAIQRCAEGAKIILEGDPCTQVDHCSFEGSGNGLRRVIEVFEGYYGFSHVNLPNIYRSQIADKADTM